MATPEQVAARHQADRERLLTATSAVAADSWSRVDPDQVLRSWLGQVPRLTATVSGAQLAAARGADDYLDDVLDAQDLDPASAGLIEPRAFAGVASDGRPLESLLVQPALSTLAALASGVDRRRALAGGAATLDMMVRTQVADAGRGADQAALVSRRTATGYTRVLTPPSCSRCAVLAGRFYRWNAGFQRHPRCDCVHLPGRLDTVGKQRLDVDAYFGSLSRAEQDRIFTQAGAQAIRDGADISRVVNARRGMSTAVGPSGRRSLAPDRQGLFSTTEGVTRRGRLPGQVRGTRLMPEEIYKIAGNDRNEAIRLLRSHGYLTGPPARTATPVPLTARERLKGLLGKEPSAVRQLGGGEIADTRLLTFADGTQAVEKIYGRRVPGSAAEINHQLDAEELGGLVVEAVGVRAPAVVRDGDTRLLMEYLDGDVGADIVPWGADVPALIIQSDDGRRLGLADVLMGHSDRHEGNWIRLPSGRLAGIDHGAAFEFTDFLPGIRNPFGRYLGELGDKGLTIGSHIDLHPEDVVAIRRRLEALEPEFAVRNRLTWHREMMRLLDRVQAGAVGTRRLS